MTRVGPHPKSEGTASAATPPSRPPEKDIAGALHEVSNALTVVLGWLDVAAAELPPEASGRLVDALDVASTHARVGYQVARMAIGAEVVPDSRGHRKVERLIRTAIAGVRPEAERCGVSLQFDSRDLKYRLMPDADAALQVLTNLLLNAVEHTPEGKRVSLSACPSGERVRFRVADEGPGISDERAETLFSRAVSTRPGGAGVGLRYSYALARSKGGELSLLSNAPHAELELSWPLAPEQLEESSEPAISKPGEAPARILIVEDDAAVVTLLQIALEARGVTLVTAGSQEAFAEALHGNAKYDAALLDLSPFDDGVVEALTALRRHSPGVSALLMSGVAQGVPEGCEELLDGLVRKPFTVSELLRTLRSTLREGKVL